MNTTRSRWAAIGAAVAVALGAGGVGIGQATTDSGDGPVSAFFPIEPCRLADTRPAPNTVGPRTSPLGPGETETFAGWGTVGDCTLPSGTSGLSLNVTAVGATSQTNLRFFPADSDVPTAANLNPTPGAPPTPNAVNVALDDSGEFSVFNAFGSVAVIIDVVGYSDDHTHDDRYYTKAQTDDAIDGAGIGMASGYDDGSTEDPTFSEDRNTPGIDVTTDRAGRLHILAEFSAFVTCTPTGPAFYYLRVNGTPVENSVIALTTTDLDPRTYVGQTDDVLPAGTHTIDLAVECEPGSNWDEFTRRSVGSVHVLVVP